MPPLFIDMQKLFPTWKKRAELRLLDLRRRLHALFYGSVQITAHRAGIVLLLDDEQDGTVWLLRLFHDFVLGAAAVHSPLVLLHFLLYQRHGVPMVHAFFEHKVERLADTGCFDALHGLIFLSNLKNKTCSRTQPELRMQATCCTFVI